MRILKLLRGPGVAATLLLAGPLAACSTFPVFDADVTVTSNTEVAAKPTPPVDDIKDDVALGQMNFARQNYGCPNSTSGAP